MTDSRTTVAVVYGGRSPEHEVSCVSAGAIMSHLDADKYRIVPIAITRAGVWTLGTTDTTALTRQGRTMPQVRDDGSEIIFSHNPARAGEIRSITGELIDTIDVVFPALHGPDGEDGTIQGFFELAGVPYVGAGVLCSAAGMDKEYTKRLLAQGGIPVGQQVFVDSIDDVPLEQIHALGLPVFVKPARGGSSIGISKVDDWAQLDAAMQEAFAHDDKVLVEANLVGDEVECGVLQHPDGTLTASVPSRLLDTESGDEGFYGFDAKYLDNVVTAEIPATLPEGMTEQVQDMAKRAFRILDGEGLSRVDFFVTDNGPVINEVNTLPGFTPISMYPQMMAASGVAYDVLLDTLVQRALVRYRQVERLHEQ
ncbi:D-alanine--D-alanine ligase family protein [Corynebacterium ulceribovis]|uniref:D-alanine--D-alanine ligase family protein n=1 Tax=Corynebacterium ulceribovis TaxID=487732 RepID=UPI00037BE9BE|nr:D-alanine--D-alanine ligase family protein [Corynebacterium ulceribovis]